MNRSIIDQVIPFRLERGNAKMPCIAIAYNGLGLRQNEVPTIQMDGATVTIDANGGGGSHFRLTLTEARRDETGSALSSVSSVFDGTTGGSGTPTVCATLHALVKAINDVSGGVYTAWALNAPHFMPLTVDTFQDLAATAIPNNENSPIKCLYRTVASGGAMYMRVALPELRDSANLRIVRLEGSCTDITNGTIRVFEDNYDDNLDDGDEVDLVKKALVAAQTSYIDLNKDNAYNFRGPLVVEVDSDDLSAGDFTMGVMQGDY